MDVVEVIRSISNVTSIVVLLVIPILGFFIRFTVHKELSAVISKLADINVQLARIDEADHGRRLAKVESKINEHDQKIAVLINKANGCNGS